MIHYNIQNKISHFLFKNSLDIVKIEVYDKLEETLILCLDSEFYLDLEIEFRNELEENLKSK